MINTSLIPANKSSIFRHMCSQLCLDYPNWVKPTLTILSVTSHLFVCTYVTPIYVEYGRHYTLAMEYRPFGAKYIHRILSIFIVIP